MKMPAISKCTADSCAFNSEGSCSTIAINVNGSDHSCNTFLDKPVDAGIDGVQSSVGACKEETCIHNSNLICQADSIAIESKSGAATCTTFQLV